MSRLAAWKRRARRTGRVLGDRLGAVGLGGIALLAAAAVLALTAPPLERETGELRESAERARALLEQARAELERQPSTIARTAQLRDWFPLFEQSTADLRIVFAAARSQRIDVAKGDYALANGADASGLQRFEIVLPVKERYVTIKAFVGEVLKALPHASLAELRVERSAAGVEMLDARVRLTLFYRAAQP
jgi:hypothetical protein